MTKYVPTTQFTVPVNNFPGTLDAILGKLSKINLLGISAEALGNTSFIRFVVEDRAVVEVAGILKTEGLHALTTPVLYIPMPNKPGALGRLTNLLKTNTINITTLYGTVAPATGEAMLVLGFGYTENTTVVPKNIITTVEEFFGAVAIA